MSPAWKAGAEEGGSRLDRCVAAHLDLPRNRVQRWIREGRVRLNGAASKPSAPVAAGDRLEVEIPERRDDRLHPEPGEVDVLYEDTALVVVNKRPGITVHPGAGRSSGTLVHHLLARYPEIAGVGGPGRPGIVHRLDKGTSGVLVVARTPEAYRRLSRDFAARRVAKRYLAVVYGDPGPAGRVELPIGRHPTRRKEMAVRRGGRPASTSYRTLACAAGLALLEVDLGTGRTHQIRVHLKSLGHPLIGDPTYGEARWKGLPKRVQPRLRDFPRPALHAWRLAFSHPDDGRRVAFEAPVPEDIAELWVGVTGQPMPDLGSGERRPAATRSSEG